MHALLPQECDYEKYTEGRYLDICGRGRKWFKCNKQAISVCACVCVRTYTLSTMYINMIA